jgi:hypothetical protein
LFLSPATGIKTVTWSEKHRRMSLCSHGQKQRRGKKANRKGVIRSCKISSVGGKDEDIKNRKSQRAAPLSRGVRLAGT